MSTEEAKIPLPRSLQEIVGALLFASEQPLTANDLRICVRGVEPEEGENAAAAIEAEAAAAEEGAQ